MTGTDDGGRHAPANDGIPPWVQFIRGDLSSMEQRINGRLDKVVTTDLFLAEQGRVDGRFKDQADDIIAARQEAATALAQIASEREARLRSDAETQRLERKQDQTKAEQVARNRWNVLGWIASPIIAVIVGFVVAGGLAVNR